MEKFQNDISMSQTENIDDDENIPRFIFQNVWCAHCGVVWDELPEYLNARFAIRHKCKANQNKWKLGYFFDICPYNVCDGFCLICTGFKEIDNDNHKYLKPFHSTNVNTKTNINLQQIEQDIETFGKLFADKKWKIPVRMSKLYFKNMDKGIFTHDDEKQLKEVERIEKLIQPIRDLIANENNNIKKSKWMGQNSEITTTTKIVPDHVNDTSIDDWCDNDNYESNDIFENTGIICSNLSQESFNVSSVGIGNTSEQSVTSRYAPSSNQHQLQSRRQRDRQDAADKKENHIDRSNAAITKKFFEFKDKTDNDNVYDYKDVFDILGNLSEFAPNVQNCLIEAARDYKSDMFALHIQDGTQLLYDTDLCYKAYIRSQAIWQIRKYALNKLDEGFRNEILEIISCRDHHKVDALNQVNVMKVKSGIRPNSLAVTDIPYKYVLLSLIQILLTFDINGQALCASLMRNFLTKQKHTHHAIETLDLLKSIFKLVQPTMDDLTQTRKL